MRLFRRRQQQPQQRVVRLAPGRGVRVVGESHRQDALRDAARGRVVAPGDLDAAIPVTARLVPEPRNPHDSNAVRVDVDARPVGYLPRDVAPEWQPDLLRLAADGCVAECDAYIMGGGDRYYGIHLDVVMVAA